MLTASVSKTTTQVNAMGILPEICTDLTNLIRAIDKQITKDDPEIGHMFRVTFTNGFMDGIVFGESREQMEQYLAIGDEKKKSFGNKQKSAEEFRDFLKKALDELQDLFEPGDDDDEAE